MVPMKTTSDPVTFSLVDSAICKTKEEVAAIPFIFSATLIEVLDAGYRHKDGVGVE